MAKLAFLGLGVMGAPMARHLVANGHEVIVYNRTAAKAEAFAREHGATAAPTPAGAADDVRRSMGDSVPRGSERGWGDRWEEPGKPASGSDAGSLLLRRATIRPDESSLAT